MKGEIEIVVGSKNKEKINMLAYIENYNGRGEGRIAPTIITIILICVPALIYFLILSRYIPFVIALLVWGFYSIRVVQIVKLDESKKKEEYKQSMYDAYATADDLVKISHIHDDGLVEYENGSVMYILSGYTMVYISDDSFSCALEEFINQLKDYDLDYYLQQVDGEYKLQSDMSKMSVYTDREMMKERMDFYIDQDEECHSKGQLYRIVVTVTTSKYDWKNMKEYLASLIESDAADVFKFIAVCNRREAEDIISRDLCLDFNLENMLVKKYKNNEYEGSKVIYYGEDVPDIYKKKVDDPGMEHRRVKYEE
jgi:hypothetical protein